jgi:hypothetical protein
MFIADPGSSSNNLSILTRKYDPDCSYRIRILFFPIPDLDPGVKKAPDPGSRSATLKKYALKNYKSNEVFFQGFFSFKNTYY